MNPVNKSCETDQEREEQWVRINNIDDSVTELLVMMEANCRDAVTALLSVMCRHAIIYEAPIDTLVDAMRYMYSSKLKELKKK